MVTPPPRNTHTRPIHNVVAGKDQVTGSALADVGVPGNTTFVVPVGFMAPTSPSLKKIPGASFYRMIGPKYQVRRLPACLPAWLAGKNFLFAFYFAMVVCSLGCVGCFGGL